LWKSYSLVESGFRFVSRMKKRFSLRTILKKCLTQYSRNRKYLFYSLEYIVLQILSNINVILLVCGLILFLILSLTLILELTLNPKPIETEVFERRKCTLNSSIVSNVFVLLSFCLICLSYLVFPLVSQNLSSLSLQFSPLFCSLFNLDAILFCRCLQMWLQYNLNKCPQFNTPIISKSGVTQDLKHIMSKPLRKELNSQFIAKIFFFTAFFLV
jgi:hypothetical protein